MISLLVLDAEGMARRLWRDQTKKASSTVAAVFS
jgi:hypothetical protein